MECNQSDSLDEQDSNGVLEDSKSGIIPAVVEPSDDASLTEENETPASGGGAKSNFGITKKSKFLFHVSASTLASSNTSEKTEGDSPADSAGSPGPNRILSQNYNGTVVFTSNPGNEAELQLFRVMQRASLLAYYDTLLEMGGDDVQQLCDAGEEEFLEIMALVGMASKPLHVRRFQKALQEWLTNPNMFQTPLVGATDSNNGTNFIPRPLSVHNVSSSPMSISSVFANSQATITPASSPSSTATQQLGEITSCTPGTSTSPVPVPICSVSPSPSLDMPLQVNHMNPVLDESQIYRLEEAAQRLVENLPTLEPKYHNSKKKVSKELEAVLNMAPDNPHRMSQIRKFSAIYGRFDCKRKPEKPLTLHEVSVNEAAAQICRYIPPLLTRRDELFPLARQVVRDSGYHYSKGHSKSSALSHFSKLNFGDVYGTEQVGSRKRWHSGDLYADGVDPSYRPNRLEQIAIEIQTVSRKMEELTSELAHTKKDTSEYISVKYQRDVLQSKQNQLFQEHASIQNSNDSSRRFRRRKYSNSSSLLSNFVDCDRQDTDETDSQLSYSNASSPYQEFGESRDSINYEQGMLEAGKQFNQDISFLADERKNICSLSGDIGNKNEITDCDSGYGTLRHDVEEIQVVAAKGDNIIAVTNPALFLSSKPNISMKLERLSPTDNANTE